MSYCAECGAVLTDDADERYCESCGCAVGQGDTPEDVHRRFHVLSTVGELVQQDLVRVVLTVAVAGLLIFFGHTLGGTMGIALALPLAAGITVAGARPARVPRWINVFESWAQRRLSVTRAKTGRLSRWLLRPWFAGLVALRDATDRLKDPFTRSGVRIAGYLYFSWLVALVVYILLVTFVVIVWVVVMIALFAICLWIALRFMDMGSPGGYSLPSSRGPHPGRALFGSSVVREGIFWDKRTGIGVNQRGQVTREGVFVDKPTGIRIDEQGQVLKEGLIADTRTGLRLSENGSLVTEGVLFDSDTGYGVNESGEVVEQGVVFDRGTGIKFKKPPEPYEQ